MGEQSAGAHHGVPPYDQPCRLLLLNLTHDPGFGKWSSVSVFVLVKGTSV